MFTRTLPVKAPGAAACATCTRFRPQGRSGPSLVIYERHLRSSSNTTHAHAATATAHSGHSISAFDFVAIDMNWPHDNACLCHQDADLKRIFNYQPQASLVLKIVKSNEVCGSLILHGFPNVHSIICKYGHWRPRRIGCTGYAP
jgi:hypothetical protein